MVAAGASDVDEVVGATKTEVELVVGAGAGASKVDDVVGAGSSEVEDGAAPTFATSVVGIATLVEKTEDEEAELGSDVAEEAAALLDLAEQRFVSPRLRWRRGLTTFTNSLSPYGATPGRGSATALRAAMAWWSCRLRTAWGVARLEAERARVKRTTIFEKVDMIV